MASVNPATTIRIEPDVKRAASSVFDGLGLTLSGGVNMFLKAVARDQGLPAGVARLSDAGTLVAKDGRTARPQYLPEPDPRLDGKSSQMPDWIKFQQTNGVYGLMASNGLDAMAFAGSLASLVMADDPASVLSILTDGDGRVAAPTYENARLLASYIVSPELYESICENMSDLPTIVANGPWGTSQDSLGRRVNWMPAEEQGHLFTERACRIGRYQVAAQGLYDLFVDTYVLESGIIVPVDVCEVRMREEGVSLVLRVAADALTTRCSVNLLEGAHRLHGVPERVRGVCGRMDDAAGIKDCCEPTDDIENWADTQDYEDQLRHKDEALMEDDREAQKVLMKRMQVEGKAI